MVEANAAVCLGLLALRQHRQALLGLQDAVNPVTGGRGLADHDEHPVHCHDALQNHIEIGQKGQNHAGLHHTAVDPHGTQPDYGHQTAVQAQLHDGSRQGHEGAHMNVVVRHGGVGFMETILLIFRFGKGFHHPNAGDVLPHNPHHPVQRALDLLIHGNSLFGDADNHGNQQGNHAYEN